MPASALLNQRCWHHAAREAVVRCPECSRYYCRECVVEHLGRMICTDCVARKLVAAEIGRFSALRWGALAAAGLLVAWLVFYYLGLTLARIPSDFFKPA